MKPKVVVIVGPTASGKSDLAVKLASQFNGQIISADSRQVYKGMNIGSGKITKKEMLGIIHHLLDVASPQRQYSVARYKKDAEKALKDIFKKEKLPIIVGGTGQYIDTLIFDKQIPEVPPNYLLRKRLEKLPNEKLFVMLQKFDRRRAKEIDRHNPRRLIRAIEINKAIGKVPKLPVSDQKYNVLWIGLNPEDHFLKDNIHLRLISRTGGIIREVKKLRETGLSWKKLESFGLEYKYFALYLQGKIEKKAMIEKLEVDINHYAKRQYTWFKRNKEILWFDPGQVQKIAKITKKFLGK